MMRSPASARPRPRRGVVAVLVALCLTVLLGMLALTVDSGLMQSEGSHAQATADAAALAGASELFASWYEYNNPATQDTVIAQAVARAQAVANDNASYSALATLTS